MTHLATGFVIALPHAVHRQQAGAHQLTALSLFHGLPDDDVDSAGFVFQGDEYHSFGGARLLAHGDDATRARQPPAGVTGQFFGCFELERGEPCAQEAQGVGAQAQARGGVVAHHVLRQGGCRDELGLQRIVGRGHGFEQAGVGLSPRGGPHLFAPVARQGAEGIGCGQGIQIGLVELCQLGQLRHVGERLALAVQLLPGQNDALPGLFAQA